MSLPTDPTPRTTVVDAAPAPRTAPEANRSTSAHDGDRRRGSVMGTGDEARPDAPEAKLRDVRKRLLRDADNTIDPQLVHAAIDEAAAELAQAPVQNFLAILVERAVRERLRLRPRS